MKKDTKIDLKPQIDASINVFFCSSDCFFFCKCVLIYVEEAFRPAQELKDRNMLVVTLLWFNSIVSH